MVVWVLVTGCVSGAAAYFILVGKMGDGWQYKRVGLRYFMYRPCLTAGYSALTWLGNHLGLPGDVWNFLPALA